MSNDLFLYLNKLSQLLHVSDKETFLHYHFSVTKDFFKFNFETSHFLTRGKRSDPAHISGIPLGF